MVAQHTVGQSPSAMPRGAEPVGQQKSVAAEGADAAVQSIDTGAAELEGAKATGISPFNHGCNGGWMGHADN